MTEAYEIALKTANEASSAYHAAAAAYRSMKIGDAEYLAARKVYDAAQKAFDIAYEIESNLPAEPEVEIIEDAQLALSL